MQILLIEPDAVQAQTFVQALSREGHVVTHALSAQAAVHCADEHRPDIVVMEVQLPGHNGIEFLYEFRSYPEWMEIPVVLYTFVPVRELEKLTTLEALLGVKRIFYKPTTTLRSLCAAVNQVTAPLVS
jgi:CheY-like chemotaxis protein